MRIIALACLVVLLCTTLFAQSDSTRQSNLTFHFMNTVVYQSHDGFQVPYSGIKSLSDQEEAQITLRNTWFVGKRLGKNTSIYVSPELAGGSGLSGVAGIAGFPNGEAFRVGSGAPKIYIARAFIRHHISLSKEKQKMANSFNQLRQELAIERITITAGKFSLLDYFDGSEYANDGRTQFMNWALMTGGAYDFASDTRGNTWGALVEYFVPGRVIRFSVSAPSSTPNGPNFDFNFPEAHGFNFDIRQNFSLFKNKATFGLTGFLNNTLGARFNDIVYTQPDSVAKTRKNYHQKYGGVVSLEQGFRHWAWFAMGSWADGQTENWGFTQIDHSLAGGVVLFGQRWNRPMDRVGLAGVVNGLSNDQRSFLQRGGNGFIIGDGNLNYSQEKIVEAYYSVKVGTNMYLTLDYQYVWDMAFNADRGNIGVWGVRSHVEF